MFGDILYYAFGALTCSQKQNTAYQRKETSNKALSQSLSLLQEEIYGTVKQFDLLRAFEINTRIENSC